MDTPLTDAACDLLVIGSGLAGLSAALFAGRRGIDVLQVGMTSQMGFASGLLDLLGVHPSAQGRVLDDPWQGIERLRQEEPDHPYARLSMEQIRHAFACFLEFLKNNGYPHGVGPAGRNMLILTPAGTVKPTWAVPHTMVQGAAAWLRKAPCLVVDFPGLRGFSARQITRSLAWRWPGLRPLSIDFPQRRGAELYSEHMARALDADECRQRLISALRPHIADAPAVGFPAVLGLYRSVQCVNELQQGLGAPVFEIPTMLPSVPGMRLQEVFERGLPLLGVRRLRHQRLWGAARGSDGRWIFQAGRDRAEQRVIARAVVLCSGRFFGQGLHAGRSGINETIFNLPVVQPAGRPSWHHQDLFHPAGHPIHRAGLAVDAHFRPLNAQGRLLHPNLFAAGTILAHQDWMRQKCGSGLALATAFGAVEACRAFLNGRNLKPLF